MRISPESRVAALARPTRLRCLLVPLAHEELCVCEPTHATGASQLHVSRHLAQLREAGLVSDRRDGLRVQCRIVRELPGWVASVLEQTATGTADVRPLAADHAARCTMPNRAGAPRCA